VMFLQSFAFMHNILLIIANHDWVCRFKMLVFVYTLFIGVKLPPMTKLLNFRVQAFSSSYWSSLLSLSAFLACYWWIKFLLRSSPRMGPWTSLWRKK
jgi:hypothetical protein